MGSLKPSQTHKLRIEVSGKKIEDVTKYMKDLRKVLKRYGAKITAKHKVPKG